MMTEFTIAIDDKVFNNSVANPSYEDFFAIGAIGVFPLMAGHISYIGIMKACF